MRLVIIYNKVGQDEMSKFNRDKVVVLVVGVAAIYVIYSIMGVMQEAMYFMNYQNDLTGEVEHFDYPESQLLFTALNAYFIASIYNYFKYTKQQRACVPQFNAFKCGLAVGVSNICYSYAIELMNFPLVMMIRSCGILSVVLVGVLFTGVKDITLKLGKKKILVAVIATFGMAIFRVFDPNALSITNNSELFGLSLMIFSLIADGFLPDFQAVIKSQYKPDPPVMLAYVNKWASVFAILFSILSGNLIPMITFLFSHNELLYDLILFSFLATIGQFFIYSIVKEFKQHIVPFIITTRKIFTVGLSIFYYEHNITAMQIIGLLLVFVVLLYQFYTEIQADKNKKSKEEIKESKQMEKEKAKLKQQ